MEARPTRRSVALGADDRRRRSSIPLHGALGVSLLEVVVSMALAALVLHLALLGFQRTRGAQAILVDRLDVLEAFRVGRFVPRRELRHATPGRDWTVGGDSIALRAFRGTALVCPPDGVSTEIVVAYRGDRQPDATKDSVLLVGAGGRGEVAALSRVADAPHGCGGDPVALAAWVLDRRAAPDVVIARLFERGAYHLSGGALRYRRADAGAGRQPLTAEVWSMPETRWVDAAARLGVRYAPREGAGGRAWSGFLAPKVLR